MALPPSPLSHSYAIKSHSIPFTFPRIKRGQHKTSRVTEERLILFRKSNQRHNITHFCMLPCAKSKLFVESWLRTGLVLRYSSKRRQCWRRARLLMTRGTRHATSNSCSSITLDHCIKSSLCQHPLHKFTYSANSNSFRCSASSFGSKR